MTPLLLGLALSSSPAHPPLPGPYRPAYYLPPAPVVQPVPVLPAGPRPMTLVEFAHCFKPTPGHHEVCLVHPCTGRPVHVCFDLPPGCPRVRVNRHGVEFDYGRREVEIRFRHNGTVRVDYD